MMFITINDVFIALKCKNHSCKKYIMVFLTITYLVISA